MIPELTNGSLQRGHRERELTLKEKENLETIESNYTGISHL